MTPDPLTLSLSRRERVYEKGTRNRTLAIVGIRVGLYILRPGTESNSVLTFGAGWGLATVGMLMIMGAISLFLHP